MLTYQAERMPEQIRLKVGGVTMQQIAVYEEFTRSIPGFIPVGGVPGPAVGSADLNAAGTVSDLVAGAGHPGAPHPLLAKPSMVCHRLLFSVVECHCFVISYQVSALTSCA